MASRGKTKRMRRPTKKKTGGFLLAKKGRRKNTQKGNPRKNKSFVTRPSTKAGFVEHVYNIGGKKKVVLVAKKGAKAAPKSATKAGRKFKRKPKGPGGGQFSK